jgi:hypothetical protein
MTGSVLETARASLLSRELELQLQLGNCVEALMLLEAGRRDDRIVGVIALTADRLRSAADDLGGGSRTVAQTASALSVLRAAQTALGSSSDPGSVERLKLELGKMADSLQLSISDPDHMPDTAGLVRQLLSLHGALTAMTGIKPDEVHGLSRYE